MNTIEKRNYMNWIEKLLTNKNGISILTFPLMPVNLNIGDKQKAKKIKNFFDDINLFMSSKNMDDDSYYIGYNNNIYELGCNRSDDYNLYYVVITNNPKKEVIYFDYLLREINLNYNKKAKKEYSFHTNTTDDEECYKKLFTTKILEYSKK